MTVPVEKKLLVLDMNGLLVETFHPADKRPKDPPPDGRVGNHKFVYKRPFCNQFIEFCFQNFAVGIWSSAQKQNVDKLVDFVFGDLKEKLLFCWYQTDCTDTGLRLPENRRKPLFLKELSKLWNKVKPDLPWEVGQYGPSNTLMIDDTPYKALCNPPHTAVFPDPYEAANKQDDILGCSLQKYLEGLSTASNVQEYVKCHLFGQPAISTKSQNWHFYHQVILTKKPLENHYTGDNRSKSHLVTGTDQHSVSGIGIEKNSVADSKEKKKGRSHLANSIHQQTVHGMEREENVLVERVVIHQAALSEKHKSHDLCNGDKKAGLCSDYVFQSESVLKKGPSFSKQKKKQKSHLATSICKQTVHGMEREENGLGERVVIHQASLSEKHKSHYLPNEDKNVGLCSDYALQSESVLKKGSSFSKRKKKRKAHLATCFYQHMLHALLHSREKKRKFYLTT